jgi:hypothetical protein
MNNNAFHFLDTTIKVQPDTIEFIKGDFDSYDANAILLVPKDNYDKLFKINIKYDNFDCISTNNIKYVVDHNEWKHTAFSNATVETNNAIDPDVGEEYQKIKFDFIRYILKDITNSTKLNALFVNKEAMVSEIEFIDHLLNYKIKHVLQEYGGNYETPYTNENIENNPLKDYISESLSVRCDDIRRKKFINMLKSRVHQLYDYAKQQTFYIYGTTRKYGTGYYYPIYLTNHDKNRSGIVFTDVFCHMKFYIDTSNAGFATSEIPETETYMNYETIDSSFISLPFDYHDNLAIKIKYVPSSSYFSSELLPERSYKVLLSMTLENEKTFQIDHSLNTMFDSSLNINVLDISINTSLSFFSNKDPENISRSPYNYYPKMYDISNLSFYSNSEYWNIEIYTRPFDLLQSYGNKFVSQYKTSSWNEISIFDISWNDNYNNVTASFDELLNNKIQNETNGYQEIMEIVVKHQTNNDNPSITDNFGNMSIEFKDGKRVFFKV